MAKVETSIVVNRPVGEVFQFISINENALQWQPGLLETRITNDVKGVGKAWIDVAQFLGRRLEVPFQLTDLFCFRCGSPKRFHSPCRLVTHCSELTGPMFCTA